ncbi:MAG: hypothetical protein K8953_06880, partial [Proteobacteria bacterium]|nr:hypothetical protein [Pseudomonadota bacterium]
MTYIKLLTVLTTLALLTACGGSSPTTPANNSTGGDNSGGDNSGGDNSGGDNSGGDNSGGDNSGGDNSGGNNNGGDNSGGNNNGGDNSGGNNNGGGGGNATDCTQTPFHTDCLTNNAPALALRQSRCLANPAIDPSCGGILTTYCATNDVTACPNVTYADWLAVATPLATRTTPTAKNEFLQGTATGLITIADANSTAVTLATAKYDGVALGGESADGFAYYSDNTNHYAGILLNTDLGAPLTASSAVALWRGQFSVLEGAGAVVSSSFVLGVSFTDTATGGTINGESGTLDYAFTGTFDNRGVIDGTINRSVVVGTSPNQTLATRAGTLTGLIGFDGAVGAFHSNAGVADSYYGGFVARPTRDTVTDTAPLLVQYEDWAAIVSPDATPNTTTRRNQFLQGTPADAPSNAGLNAGVGYTANNFGNQPRAQIVNFEVGETRTGRVAGIGGDAADGFAIFRGQIGTVNHYYASILPTTNLGAPITREAGTAQWTGKLLRFSTADPNFVLIVDFGKSEVSRSGNGGFSLKGTWDERGVITGTTLNAEYLDDARTMVDVGNPANTPGILTGLIGQDGAVGVFYSNNDGIGTTPYIGGFIAAPSPCQVANNCPVNHAAWLGSFRPAPPATVAEAVADTDIPSHFLSVGADGVIDRAGLGRATPATTLSR